MRRVGHRAGPSVSGRPEPLRHGIRQRAGQPETRPESQRPGGGGRARVGTRAVPPAPGPPVQEGFKRGCCHAAAARDPASSGANPLRGRDSLLAPGRGQARGRCPSGRPHPEPNATPADADAVTGCRGATAVREARPDGTPSRFLASEPLVAFRLVPRPACRSLACRGPGNSGAGMARPARKWRGAGRQDRRIRASAPWAASPCADRACARLNMTF